MTEKLNISSLWKMVISLLYCNMAYTHRDALEQWKHYVVDATGYPPDDLQYSDQSIVLELLEGRALLIKQMLATKQDISESTYQTLGCMEVEEVDRAECACAPASGCYWLKSKEPLPDVIKIRSVTGIVAAAEMPRFDPIKWDRFQYIPQSRIPSMARGFYYAIRDTGNGPYLYLYGNRFLEAVSVSAIFQNPMVAAAFPSCGEVDLQAKCNPFDVNFHTDAGVREAIINSAWQRLVAARQAAPVDSANDDQPPTVVGIPQR